MPKKKQIPLRFFTVILLTLFLVWGGGVFRSAWAQTTPQISGQKAGTINVSAYVLTPENDEILNGEYEVRFSIYTKDRTEPDVYPSNADAGARVWEETQKVTVYNGVMSAELGSVVPFPAGLTFDAGEYYLGIRINQDAEISPRKKLGTVPMAMNAQFLNGKKVGTAEGDIPTLGSGGKLDAASMPEITEVGTIKKGVWQGTVVADKYIAKTLTGKTYNGLTLTTSGSASLSVSGSVALDQALLTSSAPTFAGLQLSSVATPTTPNAGALYSDGTSLYFYNGSAWDNLTQMGAGGVEGTGVAGRLAVWTGLTEIGSATMTGNNGVAITSGSGNFSVGLDLTDGSEDATTATAASKSGLEITANGLQLVGGCSDGQVLEWETSIGGWACSSKTGGTSDWTTAGGTITYLTDTGDNFAVGGTSAATAIFGIDRTNANFRFASDSATSPNPTLSFHANGGADGSIAFTDSGIFNVSSGVRLTDTTLLSTPQNGTMEYSSGDLYFTKGTGVREKVALMGDVSGASHPQLSIISNGHSFVSFAGANDYTDQKLTLSAVNLGSEVSGTLPISNGGTGLSTNPANKQLLVGSGSSGYKLVTFADGNGTSVVLDGVGGTIKVNATLGSTIDSSNEIDDGIILASDLNVSGPVPSLGDLLSYDGTSGFIWKPASSLGLGTITAVGDVTNGAAFTAGGSGTELYFHNATHTGKLTLDALAENKTYRLPWLPVGTLTAKIITDGNLSDISGVGDITSGRWESQTAPIANAFIADDLTISGGSINNSTLTLKGTSGSPDTVEGNTYWDATNDRLVVGTSSGTATFYPAGGGGVIADGGSGAGTGVAYWTGSGLLGGEAQLSASRGGTGRLTYAKGDLLVAGSANPNALSVISDDVTGKVLLSAGTNEVPAWGKVGLTTHVSGILPAINGGTGISTAPGSGQILIGNSGAYQLAALSALADSGITVDIQSGSVTIGKDFTINGGIITKDDIQNGSLLAEDLNISNTPAGTQYLAYDSVTGGFVWGSPSGSSGVTKVGNATNAKVFGSDLGTGSTYGSELYFHTGSGTVPSPYYTGKLTVATITQANKTYTLPNASGTIITTGNLDSISGVGTILSGKWESTTDPIADTFIADDLTVTGGVIAASSITLQDATQGGSGLGDISWDSSDDSIVVYGNSGQLHFYSGHGALSGSGTMGQVTYWTGANTLGTEQYLKAYRGGTGIGSYTKGDLLVAGSTGTPDQLSKITAVATGSALVSQGPGMLPAWGDIDLTNTVAGTLPVANGGTGIPDSPTNGQLLIGNASGGYTLSGLTQGSGITITPGNGLIEIASVLGSSVDSAHITDATIQPIDLNVMNSGSIPNGYVLTYSTTGGGRFSWQSVTGGAAGAGDIAKVGDVESGNAFTGDADSSGSALFFHNESVVGGLTGKLFVDSATPLTGNRTYALPDKSGTVALLDDISVGGHAEVELLSNPTTNGPSYLSLATGQKLTQNQINLNTAAHNVSGTLSVGNGGTGVSTAPSVNNILIGNSTSGYDLKTLGVATNSGLTFTNTNGSTVATFGVDVFTSGITTSKNSNSGLETDASGLRLLGGCNDGEVLAWSEVGSYWQCASRTSGNSSWTQVVIDNVTMTHLTSTASDFAVGGSSLTDSAFSVEVATSKLRIGAGKGVNASIDFSSSGGAVGTLTYGSTANMFSLSSGSGLIIPAGTTSRPPLKILPGSKLPLAQAQSGAIENDGSRLYYTTSTGEQKTLAFVTELGTGNHPRLTGNMGSYSYASLDEGAQVLTLGGVDLTKDVYNQLPVSLGGTGLSSIDANGIVYSSNTDTLGVLKGLSSQLLVIGASGAPGFVSMGGDATLSVSGSLTIGNGKVTLGTKTSGNYVASVVGGNGVSIPGTPVSTGWSPTISLGSLPSDWLQTGDGDIVLDNANSQLQVRGDQPTGAYYGTFNVASLDQNRTYNFPNAGGSVALGSGTAGHVAYWSDANTLASEEKLSIGRGGTGLTLSNPAMGTLLIGTGTGFTLANLTQGSGIKITNDSGSVTIDTDLNNFITTTHIKNNTILPVDLNLATDTVGEVEGKVLAYSLQNQNFKWISPGSLGSATMSAVGDVSTGGAFTEAGSAGTSLWFNSNGMHGLLTVDPTLGQGQTYFLPNATGTILVSGANGNLGTMIDKVGTITSGTWLGNSIGKSYVDKDLTIQGGSINTSTIVLRSIASPTFPAPSTSGDMRWDSINHEIVVGIGGGAVSFYPGAGAGGVTEDTNYNGGTANYVAYWTADKTLGGVEELPVSMGGTGFGSSGSKLYAEGDLLYADGVQSLAKLGMGSGTVGKVLMGSFSNSHYSPAWSQISLSNTNTLTGTLPTSLGGTGIQGNPTDKQILIGSGSSGYALRTLTAGTGVTVTVADTPSKTLTLALAEGGVTTTQIADNTILPGDLDTSATFPLDQGQTMVLTNSGGIFAWRNAQGSGGVGSPIMSVGDVTTGDAFASSGTGNNLYFHPSAGNIGQLTAASGVTGTKTYTLPNATGTVLVAGDGIGGNYGNLDSIIRVGTITSGVWHGTSIEKGHVAQDLTINSNGLINGAQIILPSTYSVNSGTGRIRFDGDNMRVINASGTEVTFYPGAGAGGVTADVGNGSGSGVAYWSGANTLGGYASLPATLGGTGQTSFTVGDILYADTTTTFAKRSVGGVGTVLMSTGSGNGPAWSKITLSDTNTVTGTLGVANGGTGSTAVGNAGTLAYSDGSKYLFQTAAGVAGQALVSGGNGAPTWFTPDSGSVVFSGSNKELAYDRSNLYWDNTGKRLGIGTTSPGRQLTILSKESDRGLRLAFEADKYVDLYTASDSTFVIDSTSVTDPIIRLNDGTKNRNASVQFVGEANSFYAGYKYLNQSYTIGSGTDVSANAIMTVLPTGIVGIGEVNPTAKLQVSTDAADNYAAKFVNDGNDANRFGVLIQAGEDSASTTNLLMRFADGDGNEVGKITFDNLQSYYLTSSDERLKTNIRDTILGIDNLMQVQVRDFSFKSDASKEVAHGVIAQELALVYPQAVVAPQNENDIWMVDYSKLVPLTIKSIQDQQKEIDAQTKSFAEMEKKLATMEEENKALADFFTALGPDTLVSKDALGNVDLAQGKLESAGVVAGVFTVKVTDKDARTIGSDTIKESDQALDATESEVLVKTTMVTKNSKVFVTPKNDISSSLSVAKVCTDIDETSCASKGFIVRVKEKITKDIDFDWVIVEEK